MTTDHLPRSGLAGRILHFPLVLLVLGLLTVGGAMALVRAVTQTLHLRHDDPLRILVSAIGVATVIGAYLLFERWIERRGPREFEPRGALAELGGGLLLGFALFAVVIGIIAIGGGYRIVGWHSAKVLPPVVVMTIISGFLEELITRGLIFRLVERMLGSIGALALSAVFFGAAHLGNDHATVFAAAAIALEAGVSLAGLYMLTRRLWLAIGVHAGWNFTQGGIFGVAVSGGVSSGIAVPRIAGPEWLTGGAFGAEASVPALVVMTAFGVVVLWLAWRRGRFVAPMWARRAPPDQPSAP